MCLEVVFSWLVIQFRSFLLQDTFVKFLKRKMQVFLPAWKPQYQTCKLCFLVPDVLGRDALCSCSEVASSYLVQMFPNKTCALKVSFKIASCAWIKTETGWCLNPGCLGGKSRGVVAASLEIFSASPACVICQLLFVEGSTLSLSSQHRNSKHAGALLCRDLIFRKLQTGTASQPRLELQLTGARSEGGDPRVLPWALDKTARIVI